MMLAAVIILLLLIVGGVMIWRMKSSTRLGFSRTTHFMLMGGYIAFLVITLIISNVIAHNQKGLELEKVSDAQPEFDVDRAISKGEPIPEEELLAERIHDVDGKLSIKQSDYGYNLYYYIERTKIGGNQVTERVYRPSLINGEDFAGYNLSSYVQVNLPEWTDDEVTIPVQPRQQLVFTSFHDSTIISQFTNQHVVEYYSGYAMRSMIVHLIVPESVQLDIQLEPDTYSEITRN